MAQSAARAGLTVLAVCLSITATLATGRPSALPHSWDAVAAVNIVDGGDVPPKQLNPTARASEARVEVGFYSESLCPFCRAFTNETLAPMFHNGMADIMNLKYYPYGNAREDPETGRTVCQHGEEECRLNKVFGCVLHIYPDQKRWFPFVHCVENKDPGSMEDSLAECAEASFPALNVGEITDCASGKLGEELEQQIGAQTKSLKPPHRWVPWLTVNGVPIWDDNANLEQYICAAYQGERPELCFRRKPVSATGRSPSESTVCAKAV